MIRTSRLCPSGGCKSGDMPHPGGERVRHPPGHAPARPRQRPRRVVRAVGVERSPGRSGHTVYVDRARRSGGVGGEHTGDHVDPRRDGEPILAARGPDDRAMSLHAEGRHGVETFGKRPSSPARRHDLAGFRPPFPSTGSPMATSTFAGSPPREREAGRYRLVSCRRRWTSIANFTAETPGGCGTDPRPRLRAPAGMGRSGAHRGPR